MRRASGQQKNDVLPRLAALTAHDSIAEAAMAGCWCRARAGSPTARRPPPRHDGLVAGQLWIEVSRAHQLMRTRRIAATILRRTRREVCAELGVGDRARRRDRVWAESVRVEDADELDAPADGYESLDDLFDQVTELMIDAMEANAIHVFDAWLLGHLASVRPAMGVAGSRGRMGLTTPAVDRRGRRRGAPVAARDRAGVRRRRSTASPST